jgi:adenylyltransferase and sulfurtransferase
MLIFSAVGFPPFRTIKLRPRTATCSCCSNPGQNLKSITNTDYVQFCGGLRPDWVAQGSTAGHLEHRIQPKVHSNLQSSTNFILI